MGCFFADRSSCDGYLIRAHLIPRQLIKREFPYGALFDDGRWRRATRYEDRYDLAHRTVDELINDERTWVPCCGGLQGNSGHHGQLDHSRTLRITREQLPAMVRHFAEELRLTWWIEREYPERKDGPWQ